MGSPRTQNQEKQPTSRYHGQNDWTRHQPYSRRVTADPVSFGVPVTLVSMDALQCIAQDEEKGFMEQPLACLEAYVIRGRPCTNPIDICCAYMYVMNGKEMNVMKILYILKNGLKMWLYIKDEQKKTWFLLFQPFEGRLFWIIERRDMDPLF